MYYNGIDTNTTFTESAELESIDENFVLSDEGLKELQESYLCDELSKLTSDKIQEFLVSEEFEIMQEKGLIGKKTRVQLSKVDDLERRIGMAAIQIAKERKDPIYDKLILNRVKEREYLDTINKRYTNPARKVALTQQKNFIKGKIPLGFARA